jgi:LysR family glycine cleavage system transcriptional activator
MAALVGDDLASRRLVAPFPDISLPARTYFAYLPQRGPSNPASTAFCDWLAELAGPSAAIHPRNTDA